MILLLALALAVVWALLQGGQLSRFQSLPLRGYGLALAALLVQVLVVYVRLPFDMDGVVRVLLLAFSYMLLVGFVWLNRQLPGMWVVGIGLLANWVVILANGGYMPITYEALMAVGRSHLVTTLASGTPVLSSKDILLTVAETRLWFLSDIFVIPPPFPVPSVFSAGDAVIAVGMFQFVSYALGVPVRVPIKTQSA